MQRTSIASKAIASPKTSQSACSLPLNIEIAEAPAIGIRGAFNVPTLHARKVPSSYTPYPNSFSIDRPGRGPGLDRSGVIGFNRVRRNRFRLIDRGVAPIYMRLTRGCPCDRTSHDVAFKSTHAFTPMRSEFTVIRLHAWPHL